MPNIKSAKKRVIVNAKKTEQNKNIRSEVKTEIKKINALIKDGKIEEAQALLPEAFKLIDSAASKNILHANNAANKKSKLAKKLDAAKSSAPATPVEEVKTEEVKEEPIPSETVEEVKEEPVKKPRKPRAKKTAEPVEASETEVKE